MKFNNFFSVFHRKPIKWILVFLILGFCYYLIWPTSLFEADIFIPVHPENIPSGMTLSVPFPKGIEIRISGSKSSVKSLKDHNLQYKLDLSDVNIGDLSMPINKDLISLPSDVTITQTSPPALNITVEKESIKIVPVKVSILNKPAAGHLISQLTAIPASVTLKGPKSLLDPLNEIQTKPIDINRSSESFKKETTLDLAEGIQNISPSETVLIEITVLEKIDIRTFQDVPVKGLNTGYTYHIFPSSIEIQVKGPVKSIDQLDADKSIKVHIDLKELDPGIYVKPAIIVLPVDISLIKVEPKIFTVEISNPSEPLNEE